MRCGDLELLPERVEHDLGARNLVPRCRIDVHDQGHGPDAARPEAHGDQPGKIQRAAPEIDPALRPGRRRSPRRKGRGELEDLPAFAVGEHGTLGALADAVGREMHGGIGIDPPPASAGPGTVPDSRIAVLEVVDQNLSRRVGVQPAHFLRLARFRQREGAGGRTERAQDVQPAGQGVEEEAAIDSGDGVVFQACGPDPGTRGRVPGQPPRKGEDEAPHILEAAPRGHVEHRDHSPVESLQTPGPGRQPQRDPPLGIRMQIASRILESAVDPGGRPRPHQGVGCGRSVGMHDLDGDRVLPSRSSSLRRRGPHRHNRRERRRRREGSGASSGTPIAARDGKRGEGELEDLVGRFATLGALDDLASAFADHLRDVLPRLLVDLDEEGRDVPFLPGDLADGRGGPLEYFTLIVPHRLGPERPCPW